MIRIGFVVPGDLESPTGGYRYDREVIAALPRHGVSPVHVALPGAWPRPDDDARHGTAAMLAALPEGTPLLVDGLAYGAFSPREIDAARGPIVALVHHPLAHETGIDARQAAAFAESEKAALARAVAVVASSKATGRRLVEEFGVEAARISIAEPGVDEAEAATGSSPGEAPHLVALGAISPRKGYDVLVAAMARLADRPWRMTVAGSDAFDPATAEALRRATAASGLAERLHFPGAVDEAAIDPLLRSADLFVFPSLYEGYGMVLTEALARGLPCVTTTAVPAASEFSPPAVRRVPPGDAEALAAALRPLLEDAAVREEAERAALAVRTALPRWNETAADIAAVITRIAR